MWSARQALHLHFPPAGGRLSLDHRRVTPCGVPELRHDHTGPAAQCVAPPFSSAPVPDPGREVQAGLAARQAPGQKTRLAHLGVEVVSTDEVPAAVTRLEDAGLATFEEVEEVEENDTSRCYALHDKMWVLPVLACPYSMSRETR